MADQASEYISKSRTAGMNDAQIKQNLKQAGWNDTAIQSALGSSKIPVPPPPQTPGPPSSSHSLWDTFEHILMFISLYILATATGLILHGFVNKFFPDPGADSPFETYGLEVRWSLAAAIVTLPLFIFLSTNIIKKTKNNSALRELASRKKLIYITLVITFIILVWKLVSTVYTLLDGSLVLNFILHFAITTGITGGIFAYFFLQVKEDRKHAR